MSNFDRELVKEIDKCFDVGFEYFAKGGSPVKLNVEFLIDKLLGQHKQELFDRNKEAQEEINTLRVKLDEVQEYVERLEKQKKSLCLELYECTKEPLEIKGNQIIIDESVIQATLKTRTCESCEYSYYYDPEDTEVSKECKLFGTFCNEIGGCNKWKAKDQK